MITHNKIKVLHIITRLDPGGSSTNTIETVTRLNKEKYDAYLIYGLTDDPQQTIKYELKEKRINFTYIKELQRQINPWRDLIAFVKLFFFIKKHHFDIIHTHSSKAGILGRWAAYLAGVKFIVHTPHGHVFYGYFNKILTFIFILIERMTARITNKIITLTALGKEDHIRLKIAEADKFVPIYSGIDIEYFNKIRVDVKKLKQSLSIPLDSILFGSVARLEPIKGNEYLIEAFSEVIKKYPDISLLLIGDGPQRESLMQKAKELNLSDRIIFAGFREDISELLHIMDIFVLASLNEGMGRVILEAMAASKPVISTRVGGIPELIEEGKEGILIPPKDSKLLAEAMVELLTDKNKIKIFGKNGRKKVTEKFSLDIMVLHIEILYNSLINFFKD